MIRPTQGMILDCDVIDEMPADEFCELVELCDEEGLRIIPDDDDFYRLVLA